MQSDIQDIGTVGMAVYILVEVIKRAGFPSRYAGLLAMCLGLLLGSVGFYILGRPWLQGLVEGFWGAASASGIYSGSKSAFAPKPVSYDDDPALHPNC